MPSSRPSATICSTVVTMAAYPSSNPKPSNAKPSNTKPSPHHRAEVTFERRTIALDVILAGSEHVDVIGDANCGAHVLINQEDRAALVTKRFEFLVHLPRDIG